MKTGVVIFVVVVLLLVFSFFFFDSPVGEEAMQRIDSNGDVALSEPDPEARELEAGLLPVGGGVKGEGVTSATTVRRVQGEYVPREVTVRLGESVSFVNATDDFHWPASDVHPTHQIYSAFDPREPLGPGETWSFTFTQVGEWKFHDHLRANVKGVVIVVPNEEETGGGATTQ